MVVGRNNGVVGLTGFSDKKMSGLLFGPKKSGRNNAVVVLTGWSYGGVPLYVSYDRSRLLQPCGKLFSWAPPVPLGKFYPLAPPPPRNFH